MIAHIGGWLTLAIFKHQQAMFIGIFMDLYITLWLFNIAMENGPFIDGLPGPFIDGLPGFTY